MNIRYPIYEGVYRILTFQGLFSNNCGWIKRSEWVGMLRFRQLG